MINKFIDKVIDSMLNKFMKVYIHMDNNSYIGCKNGVIEFYNKEVYFRNGKPEDYITLSTNIDYIDNEMYLQGYCLWIKEMFGDNSDYMMKLLNNDKHIIILNGERDKTFEKWVCKAFGDYTLSSTGNKILFIKENTKMFDFIASKVILYGDPVDNPRCRNISIKKSPISSETLNIFAHMMLYKAVNSCKQ